MVRSIAGVALVLAAQIPPNPRPSRTPEVIAPPEAHSRREGSSFQAAYQALVTLGERPGTRAASVGEYTMIRDVGEFTLRGGTLYLLPPVLERHVAAVYVGDGTFDFTPAIEVEREHLRRHYDSTSVQLPFKSLVLFYADSTAAQLEADFGFVDATLPGGAERELREAFEYLVDEDAEDFDSDIMTAILNGHENGLFYAHFAENRGDPHFFEINPYADEAVSFSRRNKESRSKARELLCLFHAQERMGPIPGETGRDLIEVNSYTVEATIEDNLDFSATALLDVIAHTDGLRWVPFGLYRELEVDSVRWDDGTPASFYRGDEGFNLWVQLDAALLPDATRRLTVYYRGDLLEHTDLLRGVRSRRDVSRNFMIDVKSTVYWIPRYRPRHPAAFDLTFHTPAKFSFASVGEQIMNEQDGKVVTSRWVTPAIRNVAFNIGEFESYQVTDPRIPPVTLQVAEKVHRNLQMTTASGDAVTFLTQQDIQGMVSTDLANSMSFFQDFFGPPPTTSLHATEIPGFHGQAFPGMILLSWLTFQWTSDEGTDEIFRAHEVAHQWWGIGVDFATYHDQWISEGFSDFAGLWYMQIVLNDNEKYFKQLKESRDAIIERGDEAGPIWLGSRVATAKHPDNYSLIVYRKGAWVLHMLRNLLLDFDTMREDRFKAMMSDFYRSYLGKRATTEDFKAIVEKHVGIPMDWFFDQWVYGTEIPKYRFSHIEEETDTGQYEARVRVEQEDVSEDFKMYVPLLLDFGDAGLARLRLLVEGPITEFDLPTLPMKPKRIVFNDLESVLAEVDYVGWKN